jgi:hypothetical protein
MAFRPRLTPAEDDVYSTQTGIFSDWFSAHDLDGKESFQCCPDERRRRGPHGLVLVYLYRGEVLGRAAAIELNREALGPEGSGVFCLNINSWKERQ